MNFNDENNNFDIEEFFKNNTLDDLANMDLKEVIEEEELKKAKTSEQIEKELEEIRRKEEEERKQKEEENKKAAFEMYYYQIKSVADNDKQKEMDLIRKYNLESEYIKYVINVENKNAACPTEGDKEEPTILELPVCFCLTLYKNKIIGNSKFFEKGEKSNKDCKRCIQLMYFNKNLKKKVERVYSILESVQRKYYELKNKFNNFKSLPDSSFNGQKLKEKDTIIKELKLESEEKENLINELNKRIITLVQQNENLKLKLKNKKNKITGDRINTHDPDHFPIFHNFKKYRDDMEELKFKHYTEEIKLISCQMDQEIEMSTANETDNNNSPVRSFEDKNFENETPIYKNINNKCKREVSYLDMDPTFVAPNRMTYGVRCGNCQSKCVSNSNAYL